MPKANLNVQMKVIPLEEKTLNFNFGQDLGESQFPESPFAGMQNQGRVVNFQFQAQGPEANEGYLNLPEPSFEVTNSMLVGSTRN